MKLSQKIIIKAGQSILVSLVMVLPGPLVLFLPKVQAAPTIQTPDFYKVTLLGISCPAVENCVSVGFYEDVHGSQHPLVMTEKPGLGWTTNTLSDVLAGLSGRFILNSVSCPTADFCLAVGDDDGAPQAFMLKNGQWTESLVDARIAAERGLSQVTCASPKFCVTIGGVRGAINHPRAYVYDGTSWHHDDLWDDFFDHFSESSGRLGNGLSCPVAGHCVVGAGRILPSKPLPSGAIDVGYAVLHYDDGIWTSQDVTDSGHGGVPIHGLLQRVDCPTINRCYAVGNDGSESVTTLWQSTDGVWQSVDVKDVSGQPFFYLGGFACRMNQACVLVGSGWPDPNALVAEQTTNGWRTSLLMPDGGYHAAFTGLSCPTDDWCQASGGYMAANANDGGQHPMIATKNAGHWTVADPLKDHAATTGQLNVNPVQAMAITGETQSVTARLSGVLPWAGQTVLFRVRSGPCAGAQGSSSTDDSGRAVFSYVCNTSGNDEVEVTSNQLVAIAHITWSPHQPAYVAFGDSLTTGSSIPTCQDDRARSPWGCTEKPAATPYPDRVAQALGYTFSDASADYTASLSKKKLQLYRAGIWGYTVQEAALAAAVGHNSQGSWTPQLAAITQATGLVSGSLGINDLHFSDVVNWAKLYLQPGTDKVTAAAKQLLADRSTDFDRLFLALDVAKKQGAKVVIALYYNPYDSPNQYCGDLEAIGNRIVNTLDSELAQRAARHGFMVADFRQAFHDHGSGSAQPYVFGSQCKLSSAVGDWTPKWLGGGGGKSSLGAGFDPHPNNLGTNAMAQAIIKEAKK